jgi:hypothetical protein
MLKKMKRISNEQQSLKIVSYDINLDLMKLLNIIEKLLNFLDLSQYHLYRLNLVM